MLVSASAMLALLPVVVCFTASAATPKAVTATFEPPVVVHQSFDGQHAWYNYTLCLCRQRLAGCHDHVPQPTPRPASSPAQHDRQPAPRAAGRQPSC